MRIKAQLLLPSAFAVLSLACACERVVSEPSGDSGAPAPPSSAPAVTSAAPLRQASAAPSQPAQPARCIKQTLPQPDRPQPPPGFDPTCPDDPGRPTLGRAKMRFTAAGSDTELDVELAVEHEQRMRGLMYRKSMPQDEGMLFVFDQRRVHRFWMKNTCIALDMLFIDTDGLIVGIEENVPTMNKRSYQAGCPSLYVLEVNAGWSRRHGVQAGQLVQLPAAVTSKGR